MAKKKNEEPIPEPIEEPVQELTEEQLPEPIEEPAVEEVKKLPKIEDLFSMRFEGPNGEIYAVRKAYKPRGKLEIYSPAE